MSAPVRTPQFTARDLEILHCVATGMSQHATARLVGVSQPLVWQTLGHIVAKLGAANLHNAVYVACCVGLLPMPAPAVDPDREADESRTVPAEVEVYDLGAGLPRCGKPYCTPEETS